MKKTEKSEDEKSQRKRKLLNLSKYLSGLIFVWLQIYIVFVYNQFLLLMLGFDLNNPASLQIFQRDFEDFGVIGSGGFSVVHKVRNRRDNHFYALKIIKIKPSQLNGSFQQHLDRVLAEPRLLSCLCHPNILQYNGCWMTAEMKTQTDLEEEEQPSEQEEELQLVFDQFQSSSFGFEFERRSSSGIQIAQQRLRKSKRGPSNSIEGNDNIFGLNINLLKQVKVYLLCELGQCSLLKHIRQRNQTNNNKSKIVLQNYQIILSIIEGLAYIHGQKIIHRDIKLENIILGTDNKCKIIDFGLAKKLKFQKLGNDKFMSTALNQQQQERHSSSIGTRMFSSPEQTNSDNYDYRTDIYSLGLIIGILFSSCITAHQQCELLLNLRCRRLDSFNFDVRLKILVDRCLSQQKLRPELKEMKQCLKTLIRQQRQKSSRVVHPNRQKQNENRNLNRTENEMKKAKGDNKNIQRDKCKGHPNLWIREERAI